MTSVPRFVDKRIGVCDIHEIRDGLLLIHERGRPLGPVRDHKVAFRLRDLDQVTMEAVQPSRSAANLLGLATILGIVPVGLITKAVAGSSFAIVLLPLGWVTVGGLLTFRPPFKDHIVYFRRKGGQAAVGLPRAGRFKSERDTFVAQLAEAIRSAELEPAPLDLQPTAGQESPGSVDTSSVPVRYTDKDAGLITTYEVDEGRVIVDSKRRPFSRQTPMHAEFRISELDPLLEEAQFRDQSVTRKIFWPLVVILSLATPILGIKFEWSEGLFTAALVGSWGISSLLSRLHTVRRHVIYFRSRESGATLFTVGANRRTRIARDAFVGALRTRIESAHQASLGPGPSSQ